MKHLLTFCILTCLSTSLFADGAFRDDAPDGFIHLTFPNRDPKLEPVDVFLPTRNIVEIKISSFEGEEDDGLIFEVRIFTNGTKTFMKESSSMFYILEFKTQAEAMKCANRLMAITAKDAAGSRQPAISPKSNAEGSEKAGTESK